MVSVRNRTVRSQTPDQRTASSSPDSSPIHIPNLPRSYQISQKIWSFQQGSMKLSEYFTTLKTLWDDLDGAKCVGTCHTCDCCKIVDQNAEHAKIVKLMSGLNDSYATIRSQIMMKKPIPTLSEVYNLLDQDFNQRNIGSTSSASAFNVSATPSDSVSVNAAYHTNPRQPKVQCNKITENYISDPQKSSLATRSPLNTTVSILKPEFVSKSRHMTNFEHHMWSCEDCLLLIDLFVDGLDPDPKKHKNVKPLSHKHKLDILKEAKASFRHFVPGNRIGMGDLLRLLFMKQTHEEFGIIRELILLCKDKARRGVNIPKTLDFLPRTEEEIQRLRSYLAQFSSYSFSAYEVLNRLTTEQSYKTACILRRIVHCLFRDFMKKLQDEDAAVVEIAPAPAKKGARKPAAAKPPQRLAEAEDQDYDAAVVEIAPAKKGGRKQAAAKAKPPPAPRRQGNQPKIVTDQKSSSVTERFAEAEDQDEYTQYEAAVVEVAPAKKGGRKQAAAKAKTPPAPRRQGNQPEIVTDQKSSSVTERFAEGEEITLDTKTRSRPKRDIRRPKRYDE